MRILFLGDVVGRSGRTAIAARLAGLRRDWAADFVIVNGENATAGMGLSADHARALLAAGADVVTLGDHAFDQKDIGPFMEQERRIVRPANFSRVAPGRGWLLCEAPGGRKVLVASVLGRVFMKQPFDDPFSAVDSVLRAHPLGASIAAAVVEVHAEATSEKMALGHWCDGRASLVVGTHTHVPTADAVILKRGTAYLTDAGMCGDYDSVIGMDPLEPLRRFTTGMTRARFEPAGGEATLSGVLVETDDTTGLARSIAPVRQGGRLSPAHPPVS